jgi:hypothetical protein
MGAVAVVVLLNANTVPSLTEAFGKIAEELRHQYTICYYPSDSAGNSVFRRIRVETVRPDIRIRARKGYRFAGFVPFAD